ncbi:hypothetical protein D3C72_619170 [compost metagenome]
MIIDQVAFRTTLCTLVAIDQPFRGLIFKWFDPFHIDLTGSAFITVHYTAGTFAQLHAFDKCTRGKAQAGNGCQSADIRNILSGKCCICTRQTQHLDLLIATYGIGKSDIHRRGSFKTFAQVTAGRLHQFAAADLFYFHRTTEANLGGLTTTDHFYRP